MSFGEIPRGKQTIVDADGDQLEINSDGTTGTKITVDTNLEGGGKISVGVTAVEVTFSGTTRSVIVSADIDNSGTLYIGKSSVTSAGANAIAFLEPGESLTLNYDDVTNAIYVVASIASQNFWKGATI